MKKNLILGLILLLSLLLRVVNIGDIPLGLHADEASFLINSVSLLETGRDEDGRLLPLFLESIKDSKPALYSYLQIPFIAILGPTIAASRLPAVFLGVFSIYLAYFLVLKISKSKLWGLLTAFLLAISPWHIMNTRSTQEVILSFVFIQLALLVSYNLLSWLEDDNKLTLKNLPFSKLVGLFVSSILAMYSYHSSKILLIVFFAGALGLLLRQKFQIKRLVKIGLIFGVIFAAFSLTAISAITRFNAIGLLSSDLPKAQIFEFTTLSSGITPLLLLRAFYNKIVFYGLLFIDQYFQHFSPTYFFTQGGSTKRQLIPMHGLFYLVESVLMALGLANLFAGRRFQKFIPFWSLFLLSSPLAAALTTEDIPSSIRPFPLILPLIFLLVLGIDWLVQHRKSLVIKLISGAIVLSYIWGFAYFIQQYYVLMPLWRPWHRSDDYDFTARRLSELGENFEDVVITNDLREMYIYLWKYGKISIPEIQAKPMARYEDYYQLGKYHFNRRHCDFKPRTLRTIVVASSECGSASDQGFQPLEKTFFRDGVPAFVLYVPNPASEVWNDDRVADQN